MKNKLRRLGAAIIAMMVASANLTAQTDRPKDDWQPIGVWPFVYKNFRVATVETGIFKKKETTLPCNIHVGKGALWFSQDNETLMEAIPDNVRKVKFENGDTFIPIGNENKFAKLMYEGELQGKNARVLMLKEVNQRSVDQQYIDYLNKTQNALQGGSGLWFSQLADNASNEDPENQPVPLKTTFYFFFKGDLFEATTKNILEHINPKRKKEYKAYTRSAEVLSYSEKSMMSVWEEFFVKY